MCNLKLNTNTLATLIAGVYCSCNNVNPIAVPEQLWIDIAEKLEYLMPWDYQLLSFEEWIENYLTILPKSIVDESDLEYMMNKTLYWEIANGNVLLIVSMDISAING